MLGGYYFTRPYPHETTGIIKVRIFKGIAMVVIFAGLPISGVLVGDPAPSLAQQPHYTFHGCKFESSSINPIEYKYHNVPSIYQTSFAAGASAWNAVTVPGYFSYTPWHSDPQIDVRGYYMPTEQWLGWVRYPLPCPPNGIYPSNEVELLLNTAFYLNSLQRKNVVIHELGHAYGLHHVPDDVCSVMQDELQFCTTFPTWHEIIGVRALYP